MAHEIKLVLISESVPNDIRVSCIAPELPVVEFGEKVSVFEERERERERERGRERERDNVKERKE